MARRARNAKLNLLQTITKSKIHKFSLKKKKIKFIIYPGNPDNYKLCSVRITRLSGLPR